MHGHANKRSTQKHIQQLGQWCTDRFGYTIYIWIHYHVFGHINEIQLIKFVFILWLLFFEIWKCMGGGSHVNSRGPPRGVNKYYLCCERAMENIEYRRLSIYLECRSTVCGVRNISINALNLNLNVPFTFLLFIHRRFWSFWLPIHFSFAMVTESGIIFLCVNRLISFRSSVSPHYSLHRRRRTPFSSPPFSRERQSFLKGPREPRCDRDTPNWHTSTIYTCFRDRRRRHRASVAPDRLAHVKYSSVVVTARMVVCESPIAAT